MRPPSIDRKPRFPDLKVIYAGCQKNSCTAYAEFVVKFAQKCPISAELNYNIFIDEKSGIAIMQKGGIIQNGENCK
jgi:hypothetical protein